MAKRNFQEQRIASLVIQHDDEPMNPREWDNMGKMVCWHDRSKLGDDQVNRKDPEAIKTWMRRNAPKGSVILPLYLYEHSGMTMSTHNTAYPFNDPWDAGQVGFIVASPDSMRKHFAVKQITKRIREHRAVVALCAEVKTYDLYLTGQCWGYVITDDEGEEDSCWGFLGGTLEETGIKAALPDAAIPLLKEAWENRIAS